MDEHLVKVVLEIPEGELESLRSFVAYSGGVILSEGKRRKREETEGELENEADGNVQDNEGAVWSKMHFVGLLVLVVIAFCISQAVNDNPTSAGPISGVGDEESPREDKQFNFANSKPMINGLDAEDPANYEFLGIKVNEWKEKSEAPGQKYRARDERDVFPEPPCYFLGKTVNEGKEKSEAPGQQYRARDERDVFPEPPCLWVKYSSSTSSCTLDGRDLISKGRTSPKECQALCDARPGCTVVESWEGTGSCYECTDMSLITEYTEEDDAGYPVYVWACEQVWEKLTSYTSWCTTSHRILITMDENDPIDHIECQKRCHAISGCNAIEFWESFNYACFQCTDTSKMTSYIKTKDKAYPVYVWAPGPTKD